MNVRSGLLGATAILAGSVGCSDSRNPVSPDSAFGPWEASVVRVVVPDSNDYTVSISPLPTPGREEEGDWAPEFRTAHVLSVRGEYLGPSGVPQPLRVVTTGVGLGSVVASVEASNDRIHVVGLRNHTVYLYIDVFRAP